MRKSFGKQTWLYPMPVLIIGTYDEAGVPDAMTAAWGGIHDTDQVVVCLSAGHKTTKNLLASGAFTVSPADAPHAALADYLGMVSANDVPDKAARAGLTAAPGEVVHAPVFDAFPLTLECRLVSYDPASGSLVGNIVNVTADERILTDGGVDPDKLQPLVFDPVREEYRVTGAPVAKAFSAGADVPDNKQGGMRDDPKVIR